MKISLSIPVYQQANFLPSALESIRVQAKDVNVAVMDATPDDSVQNVMKKYVDLLTYHRYGPDLGQTAAIQEGWDNTVGEIIAWLCADDYYFPDTVELVRQVFIEHPEVDVVYGDTVFVDQHNKFLGYFPAINKSIDAITTECCVSQPSCFVRRTAFQKIGGYLNNKLHYTMDWDLWIRLYKSGAKFTYLNKPLSVVRMYEGTKTSSRSWLRYYEVARHLFKNTTPFLALRSMLGFYYQDLLLSNDCWFDKLMLNLLDRYRAHKAEKLSSTNEQKFNYGFLSHSHVVNYQVDIYLPWYGNDGPTKVIVHCDLQVAPIAFLNNIRINSTEPEFTYKITDLNASVHLLNLKLLSPDNRSWRLYNVEFV